jgi:hypothetical protein
MHCPVGRRFGRRCGMLGLMVAGFAGIAACQVGPPAGSARSRASQRHASEHRVSELVAQVRAKDPAATLLAREIGAPAAAELIPLTKDADEEVREIALLCLAETGGIRAVRAMLARLNDGGPMVRGAALRGLERQAAAADVPALLHALEATDDAGSRRYLALLIGRLGSGADVGGMQRICGAYQDAETDEGCVTAQAQLGDGPMRAEFNRRLSSTKDRTLGRYLEYAERISAPWLLPALASLLADLTPVRWIGVDGMPGPHNLRAADIAVNLIAQITGRHFSFPLGPRVNYSPEQLEEVRRAVGG